MGIMMTKDVNDNSELDRRISADLRARTQSVRGKSSDYEDDTDYAEETQKTNRFSWVWIILIVLAIISVVCIVFI